MFIFVLVIKLCLALNPNSADIAKSLMESIKYIPPFHEAPKIFNGYDCNLPAPLNLLRPALIELNLNRSQKNAEHVKGILRLLFLQPRRVQNCTVGVIAAFYSLSLEAQFRLSHLEANLWMQSAMIFLFTLRNNNKIPPISSHVWGVTEVDIIRYIFYSKTHIKELPYMYNSICAYPDDSEIALKKITRMNRETYARLHGYDVSFHDRPINSKYHIYHQKLILMQALVCAREWDWVVWLDCDSIITNMHIPIQTIISTYTSESTELLISEEGWGLSSAGWIAKGKPRNQEEVQHLRCNNELDINLNIWSPTNPCPKRNIFSSLAVIQGVDIDKLKEDYDIDNDPKTLKKSHISSLNNVVHNRTIDENNACTPKSDLKPFWIDSLLENAVNLCVREIPIFGDQDCIIFNTITKPMLYENKINHDLHVKLAPPTAFNSYDNVNSRSMMIPSFRPGHFLITFPACRSELCNDLFNFASNFIYTYAKNTNLVMYIFGSPSKNIIELDIANDEHICLE